ncbi:MAG: response regulator [Candidatus Omnitrophica bacterium]|nr:response regulator [Candidatus Omnitrophota bacterium]
MTEKKVMLVDDNKEFLEELEETLNLSGYKTISVNDANLALDAVVKSCPDVVVVDLKMPSKTGFQLADELRRIPGFDRIPIIAMSGFFKEDYGPLMNICGIRKCIKKPFNPLDMISEIEEALNNAGGE